MKSKFRVLVILSLLVMVFAFPTPVNAAKLNKKKLTISEGEKYTLIMSGTKKKAKWKSSNKRIATVSKKGVVKGKRKGTCKITATVGKKKYTCKVKVKEFDMMKYTITVNLNSKNMSKYFKVQLNKKPQFVWINKDYYCWTVANDDYRLGYNVYFKYKEDGRVCSGYSGGVDWSIGQYYYPTIPDNAYDFRIVFDEFCYGELYIIKRSAIKKVIPPYKLIFIDNYKEKSFFPIG